MKICFDHCALVASRKVSESFNWEACYPLLAMAANDFEKLDTFFICCKRIVQMLSILLQVIFMVFQKASSKTSENENWILDMEHYIIGKPFEF